jgi:hypothetical protein
VVVVDAVAVAVRFELVLLVLELLESLDESPALWTTTL